MSIARIKNAALFAALLGAGMATLAPGQALAAQVLNVGMAASDLATLDPHRASATQEKILMPWLYNGLTRFKPGSVSLENIEPDLAEKWEVSADKKVWTFTLRQDVQFHAGFGKMTAEDVVFSLDRARDPKTSSFASDFANVEKVEAVDARTVRITLKEPSADLLYTLVGYQGGFIVSKKAVEQRGENFRLQPVGTGPFEFEAYQASQSVTFKANKQYFRGAPRIDQVVYRYIRSDASRDLAYESGELDLVYGRQDQRWAERMKDRADTKLDIIEPAYQGLAFLNTSRKPFDDLRVRQAIAYAIDPSRIVIFKGKLVAADSPSVIPTATLGADPGVHLPGYDPARATALLKESGHPDGLTFKVIQTQNAATLGPAQIIQAQLKKVNVLMDMDVVEHATYHQQIRKDLSDMVIYASSRFPIADNYLKEFYLSSSAIGQPTAAANFAHCNAADAEIVAASKELDLEKRKALWKQAQQKIVDAVCAIPLFEQKIVWASRKSLDYGYDLQGSLSYGPLITEKTSLNK
ncbi:Solute-binding protein family 5 domain-containing protein [Bordetella sputigena]|uniref:ABC transporter substrate-binding protein n=1 Tax=Bordetella sputigena TaxID=1416810 RepID=UPI0039EF0C5F